MFFCLRFQISQKRDYITVHASGFCATDVPGACKVCWTIHVYRCTWFVQSCRLMIMGMITIYDEGTIST